MIERVKATPPDKMYLWLMLTLTFTTGMNDAIGYLGLDKVFTGNMTGNVVVLGMALVGGTGLPVLGPALALLGFVVGAAIGGRMLKRVTSGWSPTTTLLFATVAALMFVLAIVLYVAGSDPSHGVKVTTTTFAAVAMGTQAATARHIAVKDVTTVVVTSTLTGMAADSIFGSGKASWRGGGTIRRFTAVLVILLGALLGAGLLKSDISTGRGSGLLTAGVVIGAVTLLGAWHAKAAAAEANAQSAKVPADATR